MSGQCIAQSIALPADGTFVPGRYTPLQIDIDQPGDIHIRGECIQGIDLRAAGRGSVIVPLMIWRTTAGPIAFHVNDKVQLLTLTPLTETDSVPDALRQFWQTNDPDHSLRPRSAAIDEGAYDNVLSWTPGRSADVRAFVVRAAIVTVLLLGAALYVSRRPSPMTVAAMAIGVTIGIVVLNPNDVARLEQPVTGKPARALISDVPSPDGKGMKAPDQHPLAHWVWRATAQHETIEEPVGQSLWFIPRSLDAIARHQPILRCDARGKPLSIRVTMKKDDRTVFIGVP